MRGLSLIQHAENHIVPEDHQSAFVALALDPDASHLVKNVRVKSYPTNEKAYRQVEEEPDSRELLNSPSCREVEHAMARLIRNR